MIFRQDEPSRYPDIQCASRTLSPGHLPRERFSPWVESGYPFKPPECRQRHKPTCKRRLPGLAIAMTDKAISPLRQRMIEDMTARHFAEKVQKDYIRYVKNFTAFLGRSPETATSEDLRLF